MGRLRGRRLSTPKRKRPIKEKLNGATLKLSESKIRLKHWLPHLVPFLYLTQNELKLAADSGDSSIFHPNPNSVFGPTDRLLTPVQSRAGGTRKEH